MIVVAVVALLSAVPMVASSPSCLDENGRPVDWWIMVKVPTLSMSSDPNAASGYGYIYADKQSPTLKLTDKRLDTNKRGALGGTLAQVYAASQSKHGWLLYNDQTPDDKGHSSYGHLKGDMVFDAGGGFWLVHSVPRFPFARNSSEPYTYPAYAKSYGQSFICLSLSAGNIETVAEGLLLSKPYVYDSNLPAALTRTFPRVNSVLQRDFITREEGKNISIIHTAGGQQFTFFAKNEKWGKDLWSELVAPKLKTSLLIETWMNGATSNKMPSFCKPAHPYDNINVRFITVNGDVSWSETKDHSKWAIADSSGSGYFCVGDINRQFSQANRGGGAVCAAIPQVWSSLRSIITGRDVCS